jgi:hypothetical protein
MTTASNTPQTLDEALPESVRTRAAWWVAVALLSGVLLAPLPIALRLLPVAAAVTAIAGVAITDADPASPPSEHIQTGRADPDYRNICPQTAIICRRVDEAGRTGQQVTHSPGRQRRKLKARLENGWSRLAMIAHQRRN